MCHGPMIQAYVIHQSRMHGQLAAMLVYDKPPSPSLLESHPTRTSTVGKTRKVSRCLWQYPYSHVQVISTAARSEILSLQSEYDSMIWRWLTRSHLTLNQYYAPQFLLRGSMALDVEISWFLVRFLQTPWPLTSCVGREAAPAVVNSPLESSQITEAFPITLRHVLEAMFHDEIRYFVEDICELTLRYAQVFLHTWRTPGWWECDMSTTEFCMHEMHEMKG